MFSVVIKNGTFWSIACASMGREEAEEMEQSLLIQGIKAGVFCDPYAEDLVRGTVQIQERSA